MNNLSIIICTYNRSKLLAQCFDSILKSQGSLESVEVLVVDNGSEDDTKKVCEEYRLKFKKFRYIYEKNIGLSNARNTGWKNANSDWIFYLDDDAEVFRSTINVALKIIDKTSSDIIGGLYLPTYTFGKPIWFPDSYGSNGSLNDTLIEPDHFNGYACGGVMLCKKSLLSDLHGFSSQFGVRGRNLGYGEETELQYRARKKGYKISYDPSLRIMHSVAKHKTSMLWQIKSAFIVGKTQNFLKSEKSKSNMNHLLKLPSIIKLSVESSKNHAVQFRFLTVFRAIARHIGILFGNNYNKA